MKQLCDKQVGFGLHQPGSPVLPTKCTFVYLDAWQYDWDRIEKMNTAARPSIPMAATLSWGVAMVAAWLAVSGQPWALTLLIFAVGTLYLVAPPSLEIPKILLLLFTLLLFLAGTTFLPSNWFSASFRQPFLDQGIQLPETLSPQPWLSLEDGLLLLATIFWAGCCLEGKLTQAQREFLETGFVFGLGVVALNTILRETSIYQELPRLVREGGQFENRNQTGDLLLMGGIFSFSRGLAVLTRRRWRALSWIFLTGLFMVATILNGSRAGVVLFGLGLLLLVVATQAIGRKKWDKGMLWIALVAVVGTAAFTVTSSQLHERFRLLVAGNREGRLPIYHDAVSMVSQTPWCGVGLGNFEGVFNVQRSESLRLAARCLHPDSDWLWLASELGVIGVILVAALVAWTFRIYLGKTPFPRLTAASATVAVLFLIHTFFDVGGHRFGTAWSCLYLVGLGASRLNSTATFKVNHLVLRLAGVFLVAVAALRYQSASAQPWMPTRASLAYVENISFPSAPMVEQKELLERSLRWAPLDWSLYYQRAVMRMQSAQPENGSADDFNRALFLEQSSIDLPIAIGEVCRTADPVEMLEAWQELLKRAGSRREEYYQNLYGYPGLDVKSRLELAALAGDDPNLQVMAIINQQPAEFNWQLENFLTANPSLNGVAPALATKVFDRWAEVGNTEALFQEWPLHAEWLSVGWRGYARALAKAGRYKEAVALGLQQLPAPHGPDFNSHQSTDELLRQYHASPQDAYVGIKLYFAQRSDGAMESALATLQEIAKLPKRPDYIAYLLAQSLASVGRDEAAWQALAPLIDKS